MDMYLELFSAALKGSRTGCEIDMTKIQRNCLSSYQQVQKCLQSEEKYEPKLYEEFRLNSTLILILCSHRVQSIPAIVMCKDLSAILKCTEPLPEKVIFNIIKGLKNTRYLRGILPWLPCSCIIDLFSEFLRCEFANSTTVSLAFEFFLSLLFSLTWEEIPSSHLKQILIEYGNFLKSRTLKFESSQETKFGGYFHLYLIQSINLLTDFLTGKSSKPSTYSLGTLLENLHENGGPNTKYDYSSCQPLIDFGEFMLEILGSYFSQISCLIWIEWHSLKSPSAGISSSLLGDNPEIPEPIKSVQLVSSHNAYRFLENCNNHKTFYKKFPAEKYDGIVSFFTSIAIDPKHDLDDDLSVEEMLTIIPQGGDRSDKIMAKILLKKEIFDSEACLETLKNFDRKHHPDTLVQLLCNLIEALTNGQPILDQWKELVLELCKKLPIDLLNSLLREKLDDGKNEILKLENFSLHCTEVFNQLNDVTSINSESYTWLCLQSGPEVVKHSVHLAIKLTGLAPIMAASLKMIHFICRSPTKSGTSLLTGELQDVMKAPLSYKEAKELSSLLLELLSPGTDESQLAIDICEVTDLVICPFLEFGEKSTSPHLDIAMEFIKGVVRSRPATLVQPNTRLSCLITSIALIYNNCSILTQDNHSQNLGLRASAEEVLLRIQKQISGKEIVFKKELENCRHLLWRTAATASLALHPRTLLLLRNFFESTWHHSTDVDLLFQQILFDAIEQPLVFNIEELDITDNQTHWIFALYLILPHCSEQEWLSSLKLTHTYLKVAKEEKPLSFTVLNVYHKVLTLLCHMNEKLLSRESLHSKLAINHCLASFSAACMTFIKNSLSKETSKFKFLSLVNVFNWWCRSLRALRCDPDLPCIFLSNLTCTIESLFKASELKIVQDGEPNKCPGVLPQCQSLAEEPLNEHELYDGVKPCHHSGEVEKNRDEYSQTITRSELRDSFSRMVNEFVVCVPQSKMKASVANRLKHILQL